MPDRDRYIPGVPCWIDTSQPDPQAAVEFYGELFGWQLEDVMPAGSDSSYFIARIDGGDVGAISAPPENAPPMATWNTYVWVDSADETAEKVKSAGGTVLSEPFDVPDAGRMAVFGDAEGAVFCVWQAKNHRGAKVVNEPGSLNFNVLNTHDPQAARDFYGAVFGWEPLSIPGGEMWRLPGYGDFLEAGDPELRKRMAEVGAPAGFEDVVASLQTLTGEGADVPAHWGVTFAVEDADAIAARAAELGGEILVAPFDAPWVRMTVISDPQGATFTASKFVPENRELGERAASELEAA